MTGTASRADHEPDTGARGVDVEARSSCGGQARAHTIPVRRRDSLGRTCRLAGRRRQAEHAARFVIKAINTQGLTRGEARAIEQAIIKNNPGFQNKINSVSPKHEYYDQAVAWGEQWLRQNGYGALVP